MGVGQPRVQRSEPHLGAVSDQEEQERHLDPGGVKAARRPDEIGQSQCGWSVAAVRGGDGQEEVAQQREGDADRTNEQILPGCLERAMMAVEVDQRRARQRGGLDADPQQAEVLAHRHERHRRQKQQQAAREDGLRLIAEKTMFFGVEMPRMALAAEIADAVERDGKEQDADDAQEDKSDLVEREPPTPRRTGRPGPGGCGQCGVQHCGAHQQRAADAIGPQTEGGQPAHKGDHEKGEQS